MKITELSSATIHQLPTADRKQHATEVFAFNRVVRADPVLPASAKVVSACIAETFIDHRTGVAITGAEAIADACGCSPSTVKAAVNILAATYWHVERGSQGSGHANRYRKRQPADYLKGHRADVCVHAKRANPRKEKGQLASIKGQPADMNLYTTTSEESGAYAPRSVLGESFSRVTACSSSIADRPTDTISAPGGADAVAVGTRKPATLTSEQIESLAEQLFSVGGFGQTTRHLIEDVRDGDTRKAIIHRSFALRRERRAANGTAAGAAS